MPEERLQNAIEENSKVTADFQKMADKLQEQLDAEKQKSQVNYESFFREGPVIYLEIIFSRNF